MGENPSPQRLRRRQPTSTFLVVGKPTTNLCNIGCLDCLSASNPSAKHRLLFVGLRILIRWLCCALSPVCTSRPCGLIDTPFILKALTPFRHGH
ncbi:MAG: hypothetical protein LBU34_14700 [Planctomycetaceae bacterium]|nr:hypothetical protein [Planctomycetaceae bacterium]